MVLCSAVAVLAAAPSVLRRLGANVAVPILVLGGFLVVATPSVAEPMPPVVRLTDDAGVARPGAVVEATTAHEVVRGESLWRIAAATLDVPTDDRASNAAVARFWPKIYERNRPVIGDDPNLIFPGQRLEIPAR